MQITVGSAPLTVTALGRYVAPGNAQAHVVTIYDSNSVPVVGGSATINTAGLTSGQFAYVPLSSPVVLWDSGVYYILSTEGGDAWYNDDAVVTTTADAALTGSAYYNPSSGIQPGGGGFGGPNRPYVPVDFKYVLGSPGGLTLKGSPYGDFPADSTGAPMWGANPIVMGTRTFFVSWVHGPTPTGTTTYQWTIDGAVVSPVIVSSDVNLPWDCDTVALSIPDGTHIIRPQVLDSTDLSIFRFQTQGRPIIVANHGFNNGDQLIPVASTYRAVPGVPDFVAFTAANPIPARASYTIPYTFIPGASDPSSPYHSNPAALRDSTLWYGEIWSGVRTQEYVGVPQWVTTPSGGVYGVEIWPLEFTSTSTFASYLGVVSQNSMDGTRLNNFVSPFSTYVEDPAGGGKWWGVEINGRVFNITHDGTATTVVGRTRDRTQLTYEPGFPGLTEADYDSKILNLGTFPAGVTNLGGANDLCFDPRDANILYVTAQIDNWIARINLTTLVVTVYAGTPGAPDGYVDNVLGASATFAQPSSIIMDSTGIMYVCDSNNQAIRKILPGIGTAAGTVSTLCGGTVGPTPPTPTQMDHSTLYSVTSITWDSMTNTGAVVMAAPTIIKLGWTVDLSGAVNTGGSGNPNSGTAGRAEIPRYVVSSFTDSQHFTIRFEGSSLGTCTIGTLSGPMQLQAFDADTYSSLTSVSFAAAYTPTPNVIRFNSNGDIVLGETGTLAVRHINLGSSTITRIGSFQDYFERVNQQWVWIDVDTAGMCGVVDDVRQFPVQNALSAAHLTWQFSLDGTYSAAFFGDGWGSPEYGPVDEIIGGPGHYPWAIATSKHEGRWIGTGMAHYHPVMGRIKQSGDPNVDHGSNINWNEAMTENASLITYNGTVRGFPRDIRPSLYTLRGGTGGGFTTNLPGHNTYDELNATYPTDAALGAYIQAGMGGFVPRPEIVGNALRDYIYSIRRGSLAGSVTPAQPGPNQTDTTTPIILTVSAVRNSATQITVSWTTDRPTLGMVAAGAPGNFALGIYSLFSDLEIGFGTSHSLPVQVIAGVDPVHYVVVCEDQFGNFAHTIDQTLFSGSTIFPPNGSLVTGYGTWSWGTEFSPAPAFGGAPFYRVLLNGKVVWGGSSSVGPFGAFQQMTVTNGGNLYAKGADQIWWSFTNYAWLDDGSPDIVPVPLPPPPSNFHPPYTPSLDGTTISGGVGNVTTADGVWGFGAATGSGWFTTLNGLQVGGPCNQIQVNAHGQAFFRNSDSGAWFVWESNTSFPAVAPTSGPIPIALDFTPSFAMPAFLTPIGTVIATITVTTSNGSPFAGTLTMSGTTSDLGVSGRNIVTQNSPLQGNGQVFVVTATQNGSTFRGYFTMNAM